jgi:potassium/hydrogen antiporter
MIKRDGIFITPNGSTVIEPNDVLLILSDNQEAFEKVEKSINKNMEKG